MHVTVRPDREADCCLLNRTHKASSCARLRSLGMPERGINMTDKHIRASEPEWRKSSASAGTGECVEVAAKDRRVLIRDSKNPNGSVLQVTQDAWNAFLERSKGQRLAKRPSNAPVDLVSSCQPSVTPGVPGGIPAAGCPARRDRRAGSRVRSMRTRRDPSRCPVTTLRLVVSIPR